ncbi:MAG: hypothetical protein ACOH2A_10790 [Sphingobacteriaceae bacterium]
MTKRLIYFIPLLIYFLLINNLLVIAQDTVKLVDNSLAGQYKELLAKSNHFQDYKVVKVYRLSALYKNFTDSLNKEKRSATSIEQALASQSKEISQLKSNLSKKDLELSAVHSRLDEISLLGIPMAKLSYNLLMWGLLILVAIALAVIVFKSSAYRREAQHRIHLFDEISQEYKTYKTRSNDKEKKLARALQDEINKVAELSGRHH